MSEVGGQIEASLKPMRQPVSAANSMTIVMQQCILLLFRVLVCSSQSQVSKNKHEFEERHASIVFKNQSNFEALEIAIIQKVVFTT